MFFSQCIVQTIYNMRTVAALQCEDRKVDEYDMHLDEAKIAGEVRAKKMGIANGLLFSTGNMQTGLTLCEYFSYSSIDPAVCAVIRALPKQQYTWP